MVYFTRFLCLGGLGSLTAEEGVEAAARAGAELLGALAEEEVFNLSRTNAINYFKFKDKMSKK